MPKLWYWTSTHVDAFDTVVGPVAAKFKGRPRTRSVEVLEPDKIGEGDVVLAMGAANFEELQAAGYVPKNRSIGSLRGVPIPVGKGSLLVTYDPMLAAWFDTVMLPEIRWDVKLAMRLCTTGDVRPRYKHKYEYVEDFDDLCRWVAAEYERTGEPVPITSDTETMGLFPWYDDKDVLYISFTYKRGRAQVLDCRDHQEDLKAGRGKLWRQIHWLLNSPRVRLRGANWKYDAVWLKVKYGIPSRALRDDTFVIGSLLDENRSNSLNLHAKQHTVMGGYDDDFNRTHDKGHMELVPREDMLPYAGGDTDAGHRTADHMVPVLSREVDGALDAFYRTILLPTVKAFEDIEIGGVHVDLDRFAELRGKLISEAEVLEKELWAMIPVRVQILHEKDLKLKPTLLRDLYFSEHGWGLQPKMFTAKPDKDGNPRPSTAATHFEMFDDHPVAGKFSAKVKKYNQRMKTVQTYIDGFMKHLRPDGMFHPTYNFGKGSMYEKEDHSAAGTVTGRLSAQNPAIQCMVADTVVTTDDGLRRLDWLVDRNGAGLKVLTHTGTWRDIVGTYRNGVQPVFDVVSELGHVIRCTGNHPILTDRGWVRVDELEEGDACFGDRAWSQNAKLYKPDLLQLGRYEEQVSVSDIERLATVRCTRHHGLREVAKVRPVPRGHGGKTNRRHVDRKVGRGRELRTGQLCVGDPGGAVSQLEKQPLDYARRGKPYLERMGASCGYTQGEVALQTEQGSVDERCPEARAAEQFGFRRTIVTNIIPAGEQETFDLTIDRCHSFVANGLVVHNTLPKHTPAAPLLRYCYTAPRGYTMFELDYDQGELRITADVANEPTMLREYNKGDNADLHALTAANIGGFTVEQFAKLKVKDQARWGAFRQMAKAVNFGLLYGMGAEKLMIYARDSFGVDMTIEQAEDARNAFFTLYRHLLFWHDRYKGYCDELGYVLNPLGRVRHLPLVHSPDRYTRSRAMRQAVNSPIQSCLSDMCLWTVAIVTRDLLPHVDARVAGATHDSIYGYVREAEAEAVMAEFVRTMENLPFRDLPDGALWGRRDTRINFPADCKIGPSLSELETLKLAA